MSIRSPFPTLSKSLPLHPTIPGYLPQLQSLTHNPVIKQANTVDICSLDYKWTKAGREFDKAHTNLERLGLRQKAKALNLDRTADDIRNCLKAQCALDLPDNLNAEKKLIVKAKKSSIEDDSSEEDLNLEESSEENSSGADAREDDTSEKGRRKDDEDESESS